MVEPDDNVTARDGAAMSWDRSGAASTSEAQAGVETNSQEDSRMD